MKDICNLKIGRSVQYFIEVNNYRQLIDLTKKCLNNKIPMMVIGGETNICFENRNYGGLIIKNQVKFFDKFNNIPSDPIINTI